MVHEYLNKAAIKKLFKYATKFLFMCYKHQKLKTIYKYNYIIQQNLCEAHIHNHSQH